MNSSPAGPAVEQGVAHFPFDRVVISASGERSVHTPAGFLSLPLPARVRHLLAREVKFYKGDDPVDHEIAVRSLRNPENQTALPERGNVANQSVADDVAPMPLQSHGGVFSNAYYTLRQGHHDTLYLTRTAVPFASPSTVEPELAALAHTLQPFRAQGYSLIVDVREAKGRNDPEFETFFATWRKRIFQGWAFLVVICQTEIGRIQLQRHMEQDHSDWAIVLDPEEATRKVRATRGGVLDGH